jgi:ABC-type nitrate/sulfonate/bicarbonate transport system substrate-binding protein
MAHAHRTPSTSDGKRLAGRTLRNIAIAALACAAAVTAAVAYLDGSAQSRPPGITVQRQQQGLAAGRALTVGHGADRAVRLPEVTLGVMADATGASALAGLQQGYYSQQLGGHVQLNVSSYGSGEAEAAALSAGQLDAAYIQPRDAYTAWQRSGHKLRIVSGATSDRHGTTATCVLVISTKFLTTHAAEARELLQAQVRATQLIDTNQALAITAARTELVALLGHKVTSRQLMTSIARLAFTNNPLGASVLDQASRAAASTGQPPPQSVTGLIDVTLLNQILHTSGQVPVPA